MIDWYRLIIFSMKTGLSCPLFSLLSIQKKGSNKLNTYQSLYGTKLPFISIIEFIHWQEEQISFCKESEMSGILSKNLFIFTPGFDINIIKFYIAKSVDKSRRQARICNQRDIQVNSCTTNDIAIC